MYVGMETVIVQGTGSLCSRLDSLDSFDSISEVHSPVLYACTHQLARFKQGCFALITLTKNKSVAAAHLHSLPSNPTEKMKFSLALGAMMAASAAAFAPSSQFAARQSSAMQMR